MRKSGRLRVVQTAATCPATSKCGGATANRSRGVEFSRASPASARTQAIAPRPRDQLTPSTEPCLARPTDRPDPIAAAAGDAPCAMRHRDQHRSMALTTLSTISKRKEQSCPRLRTYTVHLRCVHASTLISLFGDTELASKQATHPHPLLGKRRLEAGEGRGRSPVTSAAATAAASAMQRRTVRKKEKPSY